jgi:hypothetical protein
MLSRIKGETFKIIVHIGNLLIIEVSNFGSHLALVRPLFPPFPLFPSLSLQTHKQLQHPRIIRCP